MTVAELSSLLPAAEARLLDVRTPSEFEHAHVAGAYNVPLDQLREHAGELREARGHVVLICQSDRRAQQAEQLLRERGMANVHVLDGGMAQWLSHGMPVQRIRARVSLERTALIAGLPPRLLQQAFAVTLVILGSYVLLNT